MKSIQFVTVLFWSVRKKNEPDSKNSTYLKTVLGIGYKFSVDSVGGVIFHSWFIYLLLDKKTAVNL